MSSDLQWQLIRHSNAFVVKRDGITFSSEPGNLTNKHSFKFSGLVNRKTVGVEVKDKKISLALKNVRHANKPLTSTIRVPLNRHTVSGSSFAAKTIRSLTEKSHYRPDLTRFAIARYHALRNAVKLTDRKSVKKSQRKRRGANKPSSA